MSSRETVYLMIEPFHAYGFELMRWAYEDFGIRCVILIEDIYEALYKKAYLPPIQEEWVAAYYYCPKSRVSKVSETLQKQFQIQAIVPWAEPSIELAVALLKLIPIKWVRPEILARFRNKYELKNFLHLHHPSIRINSTWLVQHAEDVSKLGALIPEKFVIKPIDGVSNQKIGFFTKDQAGKSVLDYFKASGSGRYVLEEYIEGIEYAVNGQTDQNGNVVVYSILRYYHRHMNGRPNVYTRSVHIHRGDAVFEVLSHYVESVLKALGLHRCPFHAEVRIDPHTGPCLVEIGARPIGNKIILLMRDAHGSALDPLRISAHFYLSDAPLASWPLDWSRYDRTQAINVDGTTDQSGLITALEGLREIEGDKSFKRWIVQPEVGRTLKVTQDLLSQPYSFHLATEDNTVDLLQEADRLERILIIKTQGVDRTLRLRAKVLHILHRIQFKFKWLKFRLSLRT